MSRVRDLLAQFKEIRDAMFALVGAFLLGGSFVGGGLALIEFYRVTPVAIEANTSMIEQMDSLHTVRMESLRSGNRAAHKSLGYLFCIHADEPESECVDRVLESP